MSDKRFNGEVPHIHDINLLERCQEELRNYSIYSKYVEPKNHTISYLAAAVLELASKYDELAGEKISHQEFMRRAEQEQALQELAEESTRLGLNYDQSFEDNPLISDKNKECCGGGCHE